MFKNGDVLECVTWYGNSFRPGMRYTVVNGSILTETGHLIDVKNPSINYKKKHRLKCYQSN